MTALAASRGRNRHGGAADDLSVRRCRGRRERGRHHDRAAGGAGTPGVPMAHYSDRAHWAADTPNRRWPVDRRHPTQVGRTLLRLGIEHTPVTRRKRGAAASAPTAPCKPARERTASRRHRHRPRGQSTVLAGLQRRVRPSVWYGARWPGLLLRRSRPGPPGRVEPLVLLTWRSDQGVKQLRTDDVSTTGPPTTAARSPPPADLVLAEPK